MVKPSAPPTPLSQTPARRSRTGRTVWLDLEMATLRKFIQKNRLTRDTPPEAVNRSVRHLKEKIFKDRTLQSIRGKLLGQLGIPLFGNSYFFSVTHSSGVRKKPAARAAAELELEDDDPEEEQEEGEEGEEGEEASDNPDLDMEMPDFDIDLLAPAQPQLKAAPKMPVQKPSPKTLLPKGAASHTLKPASSAALKPSPPTVPLAKPPAISHSAPKQSFMETTADSAGRPQLTFREPNTTHAGIWNLINWQFQDRMYLLMPRIRGAKVEVLIAPSAKELLISIHYAAVGPTELGEAYQCVPDSYILQGTTKELKYPLPVSLAIAPAITLPTHDDYVLMAFPIAREGSRGYTVGSVGF